MGCEMSLIHVQGNHFLYKFSVLSIKSIKTGKVLTSQTKVIFAERKGPKEVTLVINLTVFTYRRASQTSCRSP